MELIKRKLIDFLLNLNISIGKKLVFYKAKYSEDEVLEKEINKHSSEGSKFDLRGMTDRLKNVLIYDQDVIDKRWDECANCEFLIKPTNNCKKCGCFMKAKTRVATASCPIGKWDKEYDFIKGAPVGK